MAVHHSIPQYKLRKDRLEGWLLRTLGVYVKVELINSYYVFYLSQRLTQSQLDEISRLKDD